MTKVIRPTLPLVLAFGFAGSTAAANDIAGSESAFQILLGNAPSELGTLSAQENSDAPESVEDATSAEDDRSAWYVRVGGAWIVNHESDFEISTVSGTITGTDAFGIRAGVGARLNNWLALELDLGYTKLDYDPLQYSGISSFGNPFFGSVGGNLEYYTVMFGPKFDFEITNGLSLDLGAMLGLAYGSGSINGSETILGTTYTINGSGTAAAFAYGLRAGLQWSLSPNFAIYGGVRYEGSTVMAFNYDIFTNTADANLTPRMLGIDFGINLNF